MLDLNFVRNNLALVEEKLRLRGMDPSEVLGDFKAVDAERRSYITTLETAQKRRNELSPKIGALKQAEKKAALSPEQQKELAMLTEEVGRQKSVIEDYEQRVAQVDEKFKSVLQGVPNLPHESVPVGKGPEDNVEVRRWGAAAEVRLYAQAALGTGRGPRGTRPRARRQTFRRTICRVLGFRG